MLVLACDPCVCSWIHLFPLLSSPLFSNPSFLLLPPSHHLSCLLPLFFLASIFSPSLFSFLHPPIYLPTFHFVIFQKTCFSTYRVLGALLDSVHHCWSLSSLPHPFFLHQTSLSTKLTNLLCVRYSAILKRSITSTWMSRINLESIFKSWRHYIPQIDLYRLYYLYLGVGGRENMCARLEEREHGLKIENIYAGYWTHMSSCMQWVMLLYDFSWPLRSDYPGLNWPLSPLALLPNEELFC